MGFINDKQQSVNNVALFEVLGNLPKGRVTSSLASVTSKNKNLLPFLIDLLSVTCKDNAKNPKDRAKCEATKILMDILVQFFPALIRILKEGFIQGIKAGLACGADFTIPSPTPKVKLKLSKVDFTDLMKIDPTSDVGSTFYGKNATSDFNWFLYNLVQSGGSSTWKNILDVTYFPLTQEIEVQINSSYSGRKFNEFLLDFINSIDLLSLENMISKLMNNLTGAMSANLPGVNISLDKLIAIEKVNSLQDNINSSDPCKEEYQFDDSFFTFTNDELFHMENVANQKYAGTTNLDVGCGILPVSVDPKIVKGVFDEIRNTPPSKVNVVIEKSINSLNDSLTANVPPADKKVAKLSLNAKLLADMPKVFTNIALEPKIVVLYQISSKTVNDIAVNASDGFDYAKATKVFFEFVTRESLAALLEIIFKEVKQEIMSLVEQIAIKIIKEQADLRIKAISSIVTGVAEGLISTIPTPNISEFT